MKNPITHCFVLLGLISGCCAPKGGSPTEAKPGAATEKRAAAGITYKAFFYPVALDENATQEAFATAQKFSKFVTVQTVIRTASLGGCFLSVGIIATASKPDGYMIFLRDSGGLVIASSLHELDKAFNALEKAAKYDEGRWLLPMPSVITSYPSFEATGAK